MAIALTVVVGWVADIPVLTTLVPGGTPMVMNSALGMMLCGGCLLALDRGWRRVALAGGVVLAAGGLVAFVQYLLQRSLGVDELFWKHQHAAPMMAPGRMAPNTVVTLVLLGWALVLKARRRTGTWLLPVIGGAVLAFALLPLLDYGSTWLSGGPNLYRGMALPTTVCLVLLVLAVLRRTHGENAALTFLTAALGMLISIGVVAAQSNDELNQANSGVTRTYQVRGDIDRFVSEVARMESSARGFGLTGIDSFVERYEFHRAEVQRLLEGLRPLVADNPVQAGHRESLRGLAEQKFALSDQLLAARRQGGVEAAGLFLAAQTPSITSALVGRASEMQAEETRQLANRIRDQEGIARKTRLVQVLGSLLALTLISVAVVLTRRSARARRQAEEALREVGQLQRAVLDGTVHSIISTTPDGRISLFSRGAEKMLGYSAAEMVGQRTPEDIHVAAEVVARAAELSSMTGRQVSPGFETLVTQARRGGADEREWTYVRKDGSRFPVLLSITALRDAAGEITGFLSIGRDLTEQKQAEVALQATEERLGQVLGHAECLVWEAKVTLADDDWQWHMSVYPSGLYRRLTSDQSPGAGAGLWYKFQIPEQEEMNRRSREAMEQGRPGYVQEFRLQGGDRTTWLRETVAIRSQGPGHFWLVGVATDITERKELEAVLRATEERFRGAFDHAGIGMAIVGLDGRWLKVNHAICSIVGYDEQELMQKTFQDITHPDDLASDLGHVRDLLEGRGHTYRMEKRYFHRSGRIVWVRLTVSIVHDGAGRPLQFISQIEDISERRLAEAALRESEERTRLFAEHAPASVAMFDREMRYLVHSAKWLKDYGLTGRSILGRSHYEIFPEIGEHWKEIHRRCLGGATEINEADPFDRADGTRQWLSWRVQPWHASSGAVGGIVMFTEDITNRKELEENLASARDRALEASRMKSQFLANMSHEIRTPMNGVLGMTELLLDTPLTAEQKQMGQVIRSSGENLLTIIDDILDFSKIEAGKLRIEAVEFSLVDQVNQTLALLTPRARTRGLTLTADLPPGLPAGLSGDAGRVQQVLVNLVGNAIKFTEKGGVQVVIQARPATQLGWFAFRIEVRDTGIGLTAEQQANLFQPFSQADGSTTRKYGGTGLGLAISRQLLQLMAGRIGVESEAGRGSVFWFELELPIVAVSSPAAGAAEVTAAPASKVSAKLLVAEDNAANQLLMRLLLEKMGLPFDLVGDGEAVLQQLAIADYSAVIMDCQMPRLDGYEATRRIRAGSAGVRQPRIPIIALTAHAMASDREKCLAAGMDEYVSKPISQEALLGVLRRCGVVTSVAAERPAPARAVSPAGPTLASVLDLVQLAQLRSLPGREGPTLLTDVVNLALKEVPPALLQLRGLLEQRVGTEAGLLAHRLAGSAANLGAREFRRVLQEMETAARKPDWDGVERLRPELDRQWELVRDALVRLQSTTQP